MKDNNLNDPFSSDQQPEPKQEVTDFTTADLEQGFGLGTGEGEGSAKASKASSGEVLKPAKKSAKAKCGKKAVDKQQAMHSAQTIRKMVPKVLRALSKTHYQIYKTIKFEGCAPGVRPSLEQSKKAYRYAFEQFLEVTYMESGAE